MNRFKLFLVGFFSTCFVFLLLGGSIYLGFMLSDRYGFLGVVVPIAFLLCVGIGLIAAFDEVEGEE
jgi:hypothetical protein